MQPKIYAAYLNALRGDGGVSQDVLNESACDTVSFTIKNYGTANGVSAKFYG